MLLSGFYQEDIPTINEEVTKLFGIELVNKKIEQK